MNVTDTELELLRRESGLKVKAQNPTSTAFGLPQMIIDQRIICQERTGVDKNTVDEREQLKCFRDYVARRYGTTEEALKFWKANLWY